MAKGSGGLVLVLVRGRKGWVCILVRGRIEWVCILVIGDSGLVCMMMTLVSWRWCEVVAVAKIDYVALRILEG